MKELLNYHKAFDYVASKSTITEGLIRKIHRHLVEGVRGNSAQLGQYWTMQNYEKLFPKIHRRTLQRDLSDLVEKGLISQEGIKKSSHYQIVV